MVAGRVFTIADAFSGAGRLQLVAVLLGILVFGVIVLLVERRNSSHEATPPGLAGALPGPAASRAQVYRPPAAAVPIASARDAAETTGTEAPYPVPFLAGPAATEDAASLPDHGDSA